MVAKDRIEGHTPRKRFGQHFLHDAQVLERIASTACSGNPCNLLEIGPGLGALTSLLLSRVETLSVVELDRDLAARLSQTFDANRLRIHQMDILKCDIGALDRPCPDAPFRVVGNLPYNISTPLVFHLLRQLPLIDAMVFMVQKEVAQRLTAQPGSKSYGRLSIMTSLDLETELLFDVPPEAFSPPPRVDSSVIRLVPRTQNDPVDRESIARVLQAAFANRRKTLRNSLKGLIDADDILAAGIDPTLRAESLTPADFVKLTTRLNDSN